MSQKHMPSDHEISSLADQLRELWTPGEEVRPWLRAQRDILLGLVRGKWSWASMARVLTTAGITYRTGRPWSAGLLRKDFSRAQSPLKGYARRPIATASDAGVPLPPAESLPPILDQIHHRDSASVPPFFIAKASSQRFTPAVPKPYVPPRKLTAEEKSEIDENKKRILGY